MRESVYDSLGLNLKESAAVESTVVDTRHPFVGRRKLKAHTLLRDANIETPNTLLSKTKRIILSMC